MRFPLAAMLAASVLALVALPAVVGETAPSRKRQYGAIAYDFRDHRFGTSHSLWSSAVAGRVALQKCGTRRCRVIVRFWNTCAALALNREMQGGFGGEKPRAGWGSYFGYGIHKKRATAIRIAVANCNKVVKRRRLFQTCRMRVWACSFG